MRGRTFRRPLTTTRDGRARGRGGRLPGDESLTCPPVAAAQRRTARRGAPAGRPAPAAPRHVRVRRRADRCGRRHRVQHGRCLPRLAHPQRPHRRATRSPSPARSPTRASRRSRTPTSACGWARRSNSRSAIDERREAHRVPGGSRRPEVGGTYVAKFSKLAVGVSQPLQHLGARSTSWTSAPTASTSSVSPSPARPPPQPCDQVLGIQRTFLPWQPDAADTKTKTTYLWPLISTAHLTAETGSDEQQTPVFENDDLAKEIAPGGRLDQLVSLGSDLDVTWVDRPGPAGHRRRDDRAATGSRTGDTTTAGKNQAVAKQWLAELENDGRGQGSRRPALRRPRSRVAGPQRQERHRLPEPPQGRHGRGRQTRWRRSSTSRRPPTSPGPWTARIDPSIVKVATSAGADKVIARSDSLRGDRRPVVHARAPPAPSAAARRRWSRTPGCRPPSRAT